MPTKPKAPVPSFADLTHEYRRLMDAPLDGDKGRFAVMDLCEKMISHPHARDPFLGENIRGWIGKLQTRYGLQ